MNTNQAREAYSQAIETTKAAAAALELKKASNDPQLAITSPNKYIAWLEAGLELRQAQAAERVAAHALAVLLDADDLAAGDARVASFDRASLSADLRRQAEDERTIERALVAARKFRGERIAAAQAAHAEVTARRRTEGLPPPPPLPPFAKSLPSGTTVPRPIEELLADLDGPPPPPAPEDLSDLTRNISTRRIAAELAARKREEEAARETERTAAYARRNAAAARETQADAEEWRAHLAAINKEERDLEAAFLAREAKAP